MTKTLDALLAAFERDRDKLLAIVVHLNDTYLIEERPDQKLPGFARVTSTINRIRQQVKDILGQDRTLVVHSGDFLGPSRVGKTTRGHVMVELLNRLGLDACVLGNHEFDYGPDVLVERLREARFKVSIGNVETGAICNTRIILWPPEAPLVALTGIVSQSVFNSFPPSWAFTRPQTALASFVEETSTVPFRIVLTHAKRTEDREIRRSGLGRRALILGGHDHDVDWVEDDGVPIMKNLSNLQTVRVIALLAGGASRIMDVLNACDTLEMERWGEANMETVLGVFQGDRSGIAAAFPDDCEAVLAGVPAHDAAVFRRAWKDLDPKTLDGSAPLEHAIVRLPSYSDYDPTLLHYEDHESAEPVTEALVLRHLPEAEGEDSIIKDERPAYPDGVLDVRDEAVRRIPTPFGRFVAECVRVTHGADLAILNAGAFRVDALMPAVIRARDLLDCFLYDDPRAVVVLKLPREEVDALLVHGQGQAGGGGYPQCSPPEVPAGDSLKVAISSYLLLNPLTVDGYDDVLARLRSVDKHDLVRVLEEDALSWGSIIDAVRNVAANVAFPSSSAVLEEAKKDWADEFIHLADTFLQAVTDGDGRISYSYRDLLKHDGPLTDQSAQAARDELRAFLRSLPDVAAVEAAARQRTQGLQIRPLVDASIKQLRALQLALEAHPESFRRRRNYPSVFNYAANGIGGWGA